MRIQSQEEIAIRNAKIDKMKHYIEAHPGECIPMPELGRMVGISKTTATNYVKNDILPKIGGDYEFIQRRGMIWYPTVKMVVENHEGYNDMTAAVAIRNADKKLAAEKEADEELSKGALKEGVVYESKQSNGQYEMVLVVRSFSGFSYILRTAASTKDSNAVSDKLYTFFNYKGVTYYVDHRRMTSKPNRYIGQKLFDVPAIAMATISERLIDIIEVADRTTTKQQLRERERDLKNREKDVTYYETFLANRESELSDREKDLVEKEKRFASLTQREENLAEKEKALEEIDISLSEKRKRLEELEDHLLARQEDLDAKAAAERPVDIQYLLMAQKIEIYERIIFGDAKAVVTV